MSAGRNYCRRESCGDIEYDQMKTREKLVIALKPKLVCSKIKQITAALGLSIYGIAQDSHRWQFSLKVLLTHTQRYNLAYIFRIPVIVNLADGFSIEKANGYTNILTEWKIVSFADFKCW